MRRAARARKPQSRVVREAIGESASRAHRGPGRRADRPASIGRHAPPGP